MTRFISRIRNLYSEVGNAWVEKNAFVFEEAKTCGLAIAGSIGGAIASKKAKKLPGDIDFVSRDIGSAMRFHSRLQDKLLQYKTYWQIQVNHKTKFCPETVETHLRFQCPFWLPICVFVLKEGKFRQWFTEEAYPVQFFEDVRSAAEELTLRDHKERPMEEVIIPPWEEDQEDDRRQIDVLMACRSDTSPRIPYL